MKPSLNTFGYIILNQYLLNIVWIWIHFSNVAFRLSWSLWGLVTTLNSLNSPCREVRRRGGLMGPAHPLSLVPGWSRCWGYQTGPLAARMASGRLCGAWVQELKSLPVLCRNGADGRMPSSFVRLCLGWQTGDIGAPEAAHALWASTRGAYRNKKKKSAHELPSETISCTLWRCLCLNNLGLNGTLHVGLVGLYVSSAVRCPWIIRWEKEIMHRKHTEKI